MVYPLNTKYQVPLPHNCGLADLHIHSFISDGSPQVVEILCYVEERTRLDVIAITDHDEIKGSYQARELVEKDNYRFDVVVGMEVSTLEGHLLVLFLERPVQSYQSLLSTIADVHNQGGLCIVPHPLSSQRDSINRHIIDMVMERQSEEIYLDGIEIIDPVAASFLCRQDIRELNKLHFNLAEIGGSDAHSLAVVGSRYTAFAGRRAIDLRKCILDKTTEAGGSSLG